MRVKVEVVRSDKSLEGIPRKVTLAHREDESCPCLLHLGDRAVLAVDNPGDFSQLPGLPLRVVEGRLLNYLQNQFDREKRLYEELIRHSADSTTKSLQLGDEIRVVRRGEVSRHRCGLSSFEIVDDWVAMRRHVERKEVDQDVVVADKVEDLGGLQFINRAAFDFHYWFRPTIAQPQKLIEQVGLACGRD
jgi:hypothetical protein